MSPSDIIKKGKAVVRRDTTLYSFYQQSFNGIFGRMPECPTCGSAQGNRDWSDYLAYVNGADPESIKQKIKMENSNQNFKIKNRYERYRYVGEDGRVRRVYGDQMTDGFAVDYLKSAEKDEELFNKRKSEFALLPEQFRDKKKSKEAEKDEEIEADELPKSLKGLKELATEKGYPESEWGEIKTIVDMKAYILSQDL